LVPDRAPLAQFLGMPAVLQIQEPGSVRIEGLFQQLGTGKFSGLSTLFAEELQSSLLLLLLVAFQLVMIGFTWAGVMRAMKKRAGHRSSLDASILFVFAACALMLLLASGPRGSREVPRSCYAVTRIPRGCGMVRNHRG
jgi:hypothetical protein